MISFSTTMGQMTKMCQWPTCRNEKNDQNISV